MKMQRSGALIVADSLRYDSAAVADWTQIRSLGTLHEAWAQATFTWPAHMSMMVGMLPHVREEIPRVNRYVQQLWRLGYDAGTGGRPDRRLPPVVSLGDATTIVHGFRNKGYLTMGTANLSWFHNPIWKQWFDIFQILPTFTRQVSWAIDVIKGLNGRPIFLFLNASETHEPYSYGKNQGRMPEGYQIHKLGHGPLKTSQFRRLHARQIAAASHLDVDVVRLYRALPDPCDMVITADHGECFGEDGYFGHGFYHPSVMKVPLIMASK